MSSPPEHDARELAEWILGTRLPLVDGADEAFAATYEEMVRRRAAREPLQRITGRMFFISILAVEAFAHISQPTPENAYDAYTVFVRIFYFKFS